MRSERLSLTQDELETILLPKLRGHAFHVTTLEGYAGILRDGVIGSNANGQYSVSHSQSLEESTTAANDNVLYHSVFSFASAGRFRRQLSDFGHFQFSS
jgi:hypothetical protein